MSFVKRDLPVVIAFLLGVTTIADYFIAFPSLQSTVSYAQSWAVVIWAFMLIMGCLNLLFQNVNPILKKEPKKWYLSLIVVVLTVFMTLVGVIWSTTNSIYLFLFNNVTVPANVAISSLLAFYVVSAAYRSFRARTLEVTLLLSAAIIVMLGNVPIGAVIWEGMPSVRNWIMEVPNVGSERGIAIGIALGTIALGIRTILGYERAALGRGGEE